MKRRSVLSFTGGAAICFTLPALAQSQRVMRVGILGVLPASQPVQIGFQKQFYEGMKRVGWEVGRNLLVDYRSGGADRELHFANANALVESNVDLIIANGDHTLEGAFRATKTLPIVFVNVADSPVKSGYAKSFSRPGGNVTGATASPEGIFYKWLEMMRAIRPGLKLGFSGLNAARGGGGLFPAIQTMARNVGLPMVLLPDLSDMAGIDPMLAAAKKEGIQGLIFGAQVFLKGEGFRRIQAWAIENKVLTVASNFFAGDVLIAHGPNIPAVLAVHFRQVDQVLRGGNPAEIPIEEPTVFDVIISRKIAKAMGLTLPMSVLLQATEVVD